MRLKNIEVEKALREYGGLISPVAEKFKVTRQAIYNRIKKSPKLAQAREEAEESLLDMTESKLISNIKERKEASIFFYLKTKGKKRGYIERSELTGIDGKDLIPQLTKEEREAEIAALKAELKDELSVD